MAYDATTALSQLLGQLQANPGPAGFDATTALTPVINQLQTAEQAGPFPLALNSDGTAALVVSDAVPAQVIDSPLATMETDVVMVNTNWMP